MKPKKFPAFLTVCKQLKDALDDIDSAWEALKPFDHTGRKESLASCIEVAVEAYKFAQHAAESARVARSHELTSCSCKQTKPQVSPLTKAACKLHYMGGVPTNKKYPSTPEEDDFDSFAEEFKVRVREKTGAALRQEAYVAACRDHVARRSLLRRIGWAILWAAASTTVAAGVYIGCVGL